MRLEKSFTVVTGASSGIGLAVAREFAAKGARVLLLARSEEALVRSAESIRTTGGQAEWRALDVTNAGAVKEVCAAIASDHGVPDILVNAAGAGIWRFLEENQPEEIISAMAAPYFGAAFMARAFLPAMLQRRSGLIVNVGSIAGCIAFPGATTYVTARWALRGLHEALSVDLANTGVRTMLATFAKVESGYWQHNPGSEERVPSSQRMIPVLTSETAARCIAEGVEQDQSLVAAPFMLRLVLFLNALFPSYTRKLMVRTGYSRKTVVE